MHKQLKRRIFTPNGVKLGTFSAMDLDPVEITFVDSDEEQQQSGGVEGGGGGSRVPDPYDTNPLNQNSQQGKQGGAGGKDENPDIKSAENKGEQDTDQDLYGNDIDDEDTLDSQEGGGSSGGGDSDDSQDGDSQSGGSQSSSIQGGESQNKKSGEDSSQDESQDGDSQDQHRSSQSGNSQSGESDGSPVKGGQGSGGNARKQGQEPQDHFDDNVNEITGGNKTNNSMEKAIEDIEKNKTDIDKKRKDEVSGDSQGNDIESVHGSQNKQSKDKDGKEGNEKDREGQDSEGSEDISDTGDSKDAARKALRDAVSDSQKDIEGNEKLGETNSDAMDTLSSVGAGSLTSLFKSSSMSRDWRAKLDMLLKFALGETVVMNPNLINKKIEDAPPGREDIKSEMKKVLILLDCSGSMGGSAFDKVTKHIEIMLKDNKMKKVTFHIIGWGSEKLDDVLKTYTKCKGNNLRKVMRTYQPIWGTTMLPMVKAAMMKVKQPDAILIMTDAEIFDFNDMERESIARKFFTKFRRRIIWVLTKKRDVRGMSQIDKTAKKMDRYVVFKKDSEK
jgi:hypothetical protein|nr:MAG TPA: hypothetical protein [Bacteriophage sp.]